MRSFFGSLCLVIFIGASIPALAQGPDYTIQGSVWGDVYFGPGSAALTEHAKKDLDEVAGWIKKHPASTVLLAGYDEKQTPEEQSVELGWKRARAVGDYLTSQGVASGKINMISFGNTRAASPGGGEEAWSRDRRVRYRVVEPAGNEKMEGMPGGVCQRCKK